MYGDFLVRKDKEILTRKRLAALAKYKNILTLPSSLRQHSSMGAFETALWELRKGRVNYEKVRGQSNVLDALWSKVEPEVTRMREEIVLRLSSADLKTQEKLLSFLFEIDKESSGFIAKKVDNPFEIYMKIQFASVQNGLNEAETTMQSAVKGK